jgi:hypothetical protein
MKTIEEVAREAGDDWDHTRKEDRKFLERFAALVEVEARADEREACLNWCAAYATDDGTAQKIDAAIRARGQA